MQDGIERLEGIDLLWQSIITFNKRCRELNDIQK